MKLQNKLLAVLNDSYEIVANRKSELENIVGDMEEVENLKVYQKLLDLRLELDEMIKAVEKHDLNKLNVITDIDGNIKII